MLKRIISLVVLMLVLVCLTCSTQSHTQELQKQEKVEEPNPVIVKLRASLNPEFTAWSPEYVVERCAEHLATINQEDRCRIRYFDMSDIPRLRLPAGTAALHFGVNSASITPVVNVPRAVPNTNNRIFWVDILWYRWHPEVWEAMTVEDPYFREPLIPSSSVGWKYIREQTKSAGPVIRGSWFLYYVFDTTQFLAQGAIKADDAFYYKLVFGLKEKEVTETVEEQYNEQKLVPKQQLVSDGFRQFYVTQYVYENVPATRKVQKKVKKLVANTPQTAAEFEEFFRINFKDLKDFPIDVGAALDEGKSGVSFRNRVLWRVRSSIGTYWRTFDVFRSVGDQDFIENPFPKTFDAGEHIFQDAKGAQFYMLSDGKGNRVEFGDPRVVSSAPAGHPAVITAMGCIKCHDVGILGFKNEHELLDKMGVQFKALTAEKAERFKQFFLNKKLDQLVKLDQAEYIEFIKAVNGLSAQENATSFDQFRAWYGSGVTPQQAARDIGCTTEELKEALAVGVGTQLEPQGTTKGRLGRLVLADTPIPRLTWERGLYQEAFLLLIEHRKHAKMQQP